MPSGVNPNLWGHVFDQVIRLSKECEITLISPVELPISLKRPRENIKRNKQLPRVEYRERGISCFRPRYIDLSFFPYRWRKYYLQMSTMILSVIYLVLSKRIRFDIIHAHFVYRPGYLAVILGKIFGKPTVITAHGSDIHQNLNTEKGNRTLRERTLFSLRSCWKIITVSNYLKTRMIEEGIDENKIFVIPCGFSEEIFYPKNKDEMRRKLSLPMGEDIIMYVGNLEKIKGIDILINAYALIKSMNKVKLLIIGDGSQKEELINRIRKNKLEESVLLLGYKNRLEVSEYINASDIVVVSSRNEGRSLVAVEAIACGKPVVASRVGGISEVINDEKIGILVEKENPIALSDAIERALKISWNAEYISKQTNGDSFSRIIPKIINIYGSLINENSKREIC